MENSRIIIMRDGFMWKPITAASARDIVLTGIFQVYAVYEADQTESLIDSLQALTTAVEEGLCVFAIELGNIYNTCLSGVKPMQNVQEITLQAVDSLIAFADCSREEAQDIALQWGLDFTEKYRDHEFDGETSYYDLIDAYIQDRFEDGGYNVPTTPSRKPKQGTARMTKSTQGAEEIDAIQEISLLAVNPLNNSGRFTHGEAVDLAYCWGKEFHAMEKVYTAEQGFDELAEEFVANKLKGLNIRFSPAFQMPALYTSTLQVMTLELYDQIVEYFAGDPTPACDLIANWTFEFIESQISNPAPDRGQARQEFMERKVKELEDEDRALSLMLPDIKFGIGQKVWYMANNRPVVSVIHAIHATESQVAYELSGGEMFLATSLFKSRSALLASL